jgi:hypothetical protein
MVDSPLGENTQSSARPRIAIALACVLLVTILPFIPVTDGYFLDDDFAWVYEFYRFDWTNLPLLFVGDWSLGIWGEQLHEYRPLWGLSFIIDLSLWGPDPRALHAMSLVYFAAAGLLVWLLAATAMGGGVSAAFLALLFFALSPIHAEPVAYFSARGHILAAIFAMATIFFFRRFRQTGGQGNYVASIGATAATLATLELGVVLPALLLASDIVQLRRRSRSELARLALIHAPFWCLVGAYLLSRNLMFGSMMAEDSERLGPGTPVEIARAVARVWLSPGSIVGGERIGRFAIFGATVLLALAPLAILRNAARAEYGRSVAYFGLAWVVLAAIPLLGYSSQRHLFLASAGMAVALGLAGAALLQAQGLPRLAGATLIAGLLTIQAIALTSHLRVSTRMGPSRSSYAMRSRWLSTVEHLPMMRCW